MAEIVTCQGCGVSVVWTGIYGDWCATCKSRDTTPKKKRKVIDRNSRPSDDPRVAAVLNPSPIRIAHD